MEELCKLKESLKKENQLFKENQEENQTKISFLENSMNTLNFKSIVSKRKILLLISWF